MAVRRRAQVTSVLRERIERAVQSGAMSRGERLPSTREIAVELDADPRVVAAAYQDLADEGLVQIRPRSGVYISPQTFLADEIAMPPRDHLADVLTEGIARGFTVRDYCDFLREAALTRRLRAAVIATTLDQTVGMSRELRTDYGLECSGVLIESLRPNARVPEALKRAQLIVSTEAHTSMMQDYATRLGKPYVIVRVKPVPVDDNWKLLTKERFYVVAVDPRFLDLVRGYVEGQPGAENVTTLLVGRDDLSCIAPGSPTYVTEAARQRLGKTRIPGKLVPPPRFFAPECAKEILSVIVEANVGA